MLELRSLTCDNWLACARLELSEHQKGMLAPNVESIAESKVEPHFVPRAICANGDVVGFLMYCAETDSPESDLYWLFRFMIGIEHQGKGFAKAALQLAVHEMTRAGARRIRTMCKPANTAAAQLYRRAGFVTIGTLDDGDIEFELIVEPRPDPTGLGQ